MRRKIIQLRRPPEPKAWQCGICGGLCRTREQICTVRPECRAALRALRRLRKQGRPWRPDARELRTMVFGTASTISSLARVLGYDPRTISQHLRAENLARRWSMPEEPLYYPGEANWEHCLVAAFMLAYPHASTSELTRRMRISRRRLLPLREDLKAARVWAARS